MSSDPIRPFSDVLLEAAARAEELPRAKLASLPTKAAIRLKVARSVGASVEHIPVYAYHLLRRLAERPLARRTLHGQEDDAAVDFLLSRELAVADAGLITATAAGSEIGVIADER